MTEAGKPEPREQAVSLIELFYDLVYVYAIAKMTSIFTGAELVPYTFFRYLVASLVVLQAWTYMTNYVNRFGRARWHENAGLVVNMCAAVFMSNTISEDWGEMLVGFNASMFVMLGTVAALYALHLREGKSERDLAMFSLKTLLPVCAIYLAVALAAPVLDPRVALALDVAAVVVGIFGPAVVNRGVTLDLSFISFPHLAERFELITIITFGETIAAVAVAAFFAFLLGLSKYHRADAGFGARDWALLAGMAVAGCALTFSGLAGGVPAFLAGPLVASAGCFCWLLYKDKSSHQRVKKWA